MSVIESAKNHPIITLLSSSGAIIALVSALFTIDARYAHAKEVEKDKQQTQQVIRDTSLVLRQQMIEDKLFELDIRQETSPDRRLSPVDSALRARYVRQLDEITKLRSGAAK